MDHLYRLIILFDRHINLLKLEKHVELDDMILFIYKLDNILPTTPDFIYNDSIKFVGLFWSCLVNGRLYYFKNTVNYFTIYTFVDISEKIYFYEFDTKSARDIQLANNMNVDLF
jgi:hypothetical protein